MNQIEVVKNNRIIAIFMGAEILPNQGSAKIDHVVINEERFLDFTLHYHSDWNWLMPVINKAKSTPNSSDWNGWDVLNSELLKCFEPKYVFIEVVKFINWYNQAQNNSFDDDEKDVEVEPCPTCGDIDGMVNPCCAGYDPLHYKNCGYG